MRPRLNGQRIALFESRLAKEISELVRRSGGVPVCVPAVRECRRPSACEVASLVTELKSEASPVFVFSTGVGASALFDEALALGCGDELSAAISRGLAVCRGPKSVAALHQAGVVTLVKARSPYTTSELVEALSGLELRDRMVVVVHYGEQNAMLVKALSSLGARLRELLLYEWELPENTAPLASVATALVQGEFAAAAFTTQVQARHLLRVAKEIGRTEELLAALRSRVVVAAVGPTCARILCELGVPPQVVPESPKMAPMLNALVARLAAGPTQ